MHTPRPGICTIKRFFASIVDISTILPLFSLTASNALFENGSSRSAAILHAVITTPSDFCLQVSEHSHDNGVVAHSPRLVAEIFDPRAGLDVLPCDRSDVVFDRTIQSDFPSESCPCRTGALPER